MCTRVKQRRYNRIVRKIGGYTVVLALLIALSLSISQGVGLYNRNLTYRLGKEIQLNTALTTVARAGSGQLQIKLIDSNRHITICDGKYSARLMTGVTTTFTPEGQCIYILNFSGDAVFIEVEESIGVFLTSENSVFNIKPGVTLLGHKGGHYLNEGIRN